jgi:hypothetical protein
MNEQIRDLISRYLDREIRIDDFQVRFAGLYFQVRSSGKRDGAELCNQIVLPLAEFSRGHRSEKSLQDELAASVGFPAPRTELTSLSDRRPPV